MAETAPAPTSAAGTGERSRRLESDAIGVFGLVFFVVAAAAPLTVMAGAAPLTIGIGNGVGAPGAYAIAGIVLLVFAVGYTAMSRYVRNAGAFYAYVSQGLGRPLGLAAAFIALYTYNTIQVGLYGLFGFFASSVVADYLGVSLGWEAWAFIAIALVFALGVRRITLSAKILGTLLILEVLILLVMGLAITFAGGEAGLTATSFAPGNIFSGAAGVAFMFGFAAFIGFEATAIYGEESRDYRRTVPRATYAAVAFLGLFYAFVSWTIVNAFGVANVTQAAAEAPGELFFVATNEYVGPFAEDVMSVLIVTSIFAALLAFHNAVNRYLYALGREGVLPTALASTHTAHHSPWVAGLVQSVIAAVVVGIFALAGADPLIELLAWLTGAGTAGILLLQAMVSVAVIGYFRKRRDLDSRLWNTLVAPILGATGLTAGLVLVLGNFATLTGAGTAINLVLLLPIPIAAAIGILAAQRLRRTNAEAYERFGTVRVADEP